MPLPEAEFGAVAPSEGFEGIEETEEAGVSSSCLMVDVEVDLLLKPLVSGAKCVSFSSSHQSASATGVSDAYSLFVNFHDMMYQQDRDNGCRVVCVENV